MLPFPRRVLFASEALLFVALLTGWWKMTLNVKLVVCKLPLCYKQFKHDKL
jgi:hypothetical protein